jgi:serine protease Do
LAAPAAATAPPALTADDRVALAARLVVLERAGKPLGVGSILNGDGRIVAALSSLGDARQLDVRYVDGMVVPARVAHADRAHDLALVVPQNAKHRLGLKGSQAPAPALSTPLGSFTTAGPKVVPGPTVTPTGPSSFHTNDGRPYPEAIAFTAPPAATSLGSALIDANGEVVAVVTRACKKVPGAACSPVLVGTPVSLVRDFLRAAPKTASLPVPSLGIQGVADDTGTARGIRVTQVRGPAAASGLRPGADARNADVIVALDGTALTTPDSLDRALEDRALGDVVDLLVLAGGRYRHVTLVVSAGPH